MPIIDEQLLAQTYNPPGYPDPIDCVTDYHRVMRHASMHPNQGSQAVSTRLELPRSRIRPWMDGAKPDCVRGIERAESNGWIPLENSSSNLRMLAELVAWIFSGGSITRNYVPLFVADDDRQEQRLTRLLDEVGCGALVKERGEGRATEIRPRDDASVFGRVLAILGAPVGEKNRDADVRLPDWLSDAPRSVQAAFADAYLSNRAVDRERFVAFREERSGQYLRELAAFFADLADAPVRVSGENVVFSVEATKELGFDKQASSIE